MQFSIIISLLLHTGFIILTVMGIPIFNNQKIDIPPIVQVEILEITEQTNVPEVSKREIEEKEDSEEKKEDVHAKWLTRERLAQGRKLKGK